MRHTIYLPVILLFCLGLFAGNESKGSLVIIGGALQPDNKAIYNTFIELGGGKESIRIAIIPAAGSSPVKSGQSYANIFASYGVPENRIKIFPLAVKDDSSTKETDESQWSENGNSKELAKEIRTYTAVFFVGGDQARCKETLKDKEGNDLLLLASIRAIYRKGGVIGGTSAGAAIMSDPMIISGNATEAMNAGVLYQTSSSKAESPKKALLTGGFGFFTHGVIDQHFLKRGRTGRLLPTVVYCKKQKKYAVGFGVDEDTAIIYRNNAIEVKGRSGVLIIDTANMESEESKFGLKAKNIILHYLEEGDSLDLKKRTFHINPKRKRIKKGKEYYKTYSLDTNIFGKDAVKEIITAGLVDNKQNSSEGLAFTLGKNGFGMGTRFVFKKTKDTIGYFEKIEGKETFSALNVALECHPIKVNIEPACQK